MFSRHLLVAVAAIIVSIILYMAYQHTSNPNAILTSASNANAKTEKMVVPWIEWPPRDVKANYFLGYEQTEQGSCRFAKTDPTLLGQADAVLIFWHQVKWSNDYSWLHASQRKPLQKYVFVSDESAAHYPIPPGRDLSNVFNWTMTYRLDSDIHWPYGWLEENECAEAESFKRHPKRKLVAQFVSSCETPSRRERITRKLKEYVDVDVYGGCGDKVCPKDAAVCREMLERDYYFYLAFENSACLDYVTEKLFNTLRLDVVPVVLARKIASAVAPNNSFIAVDDFKSIKELADYLVYLSKNNTAYATYFEWKREKTAMVDYEGMARRLLCSALHNSSLMTPRSYEDISKWWNAQSECYAVPTPQ